MWDLLYDHARLATVSPAIDRPYGAIDDGAIAIAGEQIAWVGPRDQLPGDPSGLARQCVDAQGAWITPGLIDCHTHLVFAGSRAVEFERRLLGVSYEQIAREGGGIQATVRATRAADEELLLRVSARRLRALLAEGVTTVEIKSGYGLSREHETRMLRVARRLGDSHPVSVRTTFLGAHAVGPEYHGDAERYIDEVVAMLPDLAASGLVDAVDAFCEGIGFSPEQTARVFAAASALGLPVKLHADQLSDLGGAALAARFAALSADHLEYTSAAGVRALADAGSVAVLLPGAFYVLRERQLPPIDALRAQRVPIAIATDLNPGSAPVHSLLLAMNMACTLFRLTPEEALRGVTCHAAQALGLRDRGTLEVGRRADLAVFDIDHPADLAYRIGFNPLQHAVVGGQPVDPRVSRP